MFYWSNRFKNPWNPYEVYIMQYHLSLLNNIDYFRIPYNSLFLPILLTLFLSFGPNICNRNKEVSHYFLVSYSTYFVSSRNAQRKERCVTTQRTMAKETNHHIEYFHDFSKWNKLSTSFTDKPYLPKRFFVFFSRCIQIFLKVSNTIILCSSL